MFLPLRKILCRMLRLGEIIRPVTITSRIIILYQPLKCSKINAIEGLSVPNTPTPRRLLHHNMQRSERKKKKYTLFGKTSNNQPGASRSFVNSKPITTLIIIAGGVTTQYDQKTVRLISRSNASPDAACVICIHESG